MTDENTTMATSDRSTPPDEPGSPPTRVRTRTRARRGGAEPPQAPDAVSAPDDPVPAPDDTAPAPDDPVPAPDDTVRAPDDSAPDDSAPEDRDDAAPPEADDEEDAGGGRVIRRTRRRRGTRGGRRRRGGSGRGAEGTEAGAAANEPAGQVTGDSGEAATRPPATKKSTRRRSSRKSASTTTTTTEREPGSAGEPGTTGVEARSSEQPEGDGQPTRLQTRRTQRGRTRGRGPKRRSAGAVSEETRRAIAEGPPRRMLVTVGEERTQIAVLEERTLVEHYVTRRADVSYVGNIYLGRVQNVLPGMEAAFVDIGKGRNGVLYAGEVDYDEDDLDGQLPRIEQTLKPGQSLLVQVTKDPMGTKGARLTQHLSIAGRYCVLAPGDGMLGISRKLPDEERERLRRILKDIKPEGFGLIVRTAAEGATQEQLEADVARLSRIWKEVQDNATGAKPLDTVYTEPGLVMRVIRDIFGSEYSDLVIDDEELAGQVRDYLGDVSPDMVDRVAAHTRPDSLFDAYEVTTQVRRALEKKVWLRSGGYLIIEKTEAMWVIDVNTGKFVGKDNLEETVLKNNIEAAEEIARQLRLRDMGGIIVIDFVDMLVPANREEVLKRFKRELARDKTKSRVMDISKLGLVQMTRKNVSQGLFENFTTRCETCEGRGARILDEAFH